MVSISRSLGQSRGLDWELLSQEFQQPRDSSYLAERRPEILCLELRFWCCLFVLLLVLGLQQSAKNLATGALRNLCCELNTSSETLVVGNTLGQPVDDLLLKLRTGLGVLVWYNECEWNFSRLVLTVYTNDSNVCNPVVRDENTLELCWRYLETFAATELVGLIRRRLSLTI